MQRSLVIVLVACGLSCDTADPDTIKQTVGAAVQDNLAGVRDDHRELSAANEKLATQLAGNATKLDDALSQLARLETSLELLALDVRTPDPPAIPARAPTPGRPDPAVTYKVEVGDAQTQGRDTALVTIVEWSDFQ